MQKVLITGSSGRIGRALHWRLMQQYEVLGIDLSPSSATSAIVDIRDQRQLAPKLEGVDILFHVAALHAPHVGLATEVDFVELNVKATQQLCELAMAAGVKQLIFTSTTALYGYANHGVDKAAWITEQSLPQPKTIYHRSKLAAEEILQSYASERFRIRTIRMSRCFPESADLMAVYRLHRGVDYRDVAEAHVLAAQQVGGPAYDMFVVSGETPFSDSDREALLSDPESVIRERVPELGLIFDEKGWSFPASIDRVYDASHAMERLGWRPRFGAMEVIRQLEQGSYEVLPVG